VFRNRSLDRAHAITGDFDDTFSCAHSRHSGIPDTALEDAQDRGVVRLLSHGLETGYTIFESADRRFLMHLGHPEYEASRLVHEWRRDQALGRTDVEHPSNFDPDNPSNEWRSHRNELFSQWLRFLVE
jgi:homoserine O-succinyltransferase